VGTENSSRGELSERALILALRTPARAISKETPRSARRAARNATHACSVPRSPMDICASRRGRTGFPA